MTYLLEESLWVGLIGAGVGVAALVIWLNTGHRWLLYLLGASVVLTAGLVTLEAVVITDRERIASTLQQMASDVESGDLDAILAWIEPDATQLAAEARSEFPRYDFHRVVIKHNLEVDVMPADPKEAEARFNVALNISERSGAIKRQPVRLFVTIQFRKSGDRWLVTAYDYENPLTGFKRRDHLQHLRSTP